MVIGLSQIVDPSQIFKGLFVRKQTQSQFFSDKPWKTKIF